MVHILAIYTAEPLETVVSLQPPSILADASIEVGGQQESEEKRTCAFTVADRLTTLSAAYSLENAVWEWESTTKIRTHLVGWDLAPFQRRRDQLQRI